MRNGVEYPADIERGLNRQLNFGLSRLGGFLAAFFPSLIFVEQDLGQFGVERMAGTRGHDVRLQRDAEQCDVADDIEDLVAHEFVGETERLFRDDLVTLDHDGAIERTTLDLAQLDELLDILVDGKGARRRHLRDVDIGIDGQREMLGMNAAIIRTRAGNLQAIKGQRDDRGITPGNRDRLGEREILALRLLLHRFTLLDKFHELPGRAVHDRRFTRIHFNKDVVDTAAAQGAQHMLDRMDFGMALLDGRSPHEVGDQIDPGFDLRVPV